MRRPVVFALAVGLVFTACKIESNAGVVIQADGTGTLVIEIGLDEEAQGFFMTDDTDPFEGQDLVDYPEARTREERRGDMTFWVVEADVDDIAAEAGDFFALENSLLETFTITITDSVVTVSGRASGEESFGDMGFDASLVEESVSTNIKITMPGSIKVHNATSQRGNQLTWSVPTLGDPLEIFAESSLAPSPVTGSDDAGLGGTSQPDTSGEAGGSSSTEGERPPILLLVVAGLVVSLALYLIIRGVRVTARDPEGMGGPF